jgi:hypothetical protein
MLPSMGSSDVELDISEQIVELRPIAGIGLERNKRLGKAVGGNQRIGAIEIPFARYAGVAVGMAKAEAERSGWSKLSSEVRALERIGVGIVDAEAGSVELIGEGVVVEAGASAGEVFCL